MQTNTKSPIAWANKGTQILNHCYGNNCDRFPVNIQEFSIEWSKNIDREEPISTVAGRDFDEGIEGCLIQSPKTRKEWGIFYNKNIDHTGRVRFTIAHELGHYILHRNSLSIKQINCTQDDIERWDQEHDMREYEANIFAATLLMPLDDFRKQIPERQKTDLNQLSQISRRYDVSLLATTLRWLDYTTTRSVLVLSRDGFILWSKSSKTAFKSGAFIKTRNLPPIQVPKNSPLALNSEGSLLHSEASWFPEIVHEESIISQKHDLCISLLTLEKHIGKTESEKEPEDLLDYFQRPR